MKEIIINDFQKGIAHSPHLGFEEINNLSTELDGTVSLNFALENDTNASKTGIAIVSNSASNDTITVASNALGTETVVACVFSSGTPPAGLSQGRYYWLVRQNATTYKVGDTYALAKAGTFIDITSDTTGTSVIVTTERPVNAFQGVASNGTRLFAVEGNKIWTRLVTAGSKWNLMIFENNEIYKDIVYWKGYLIIFSTTHIGYFGTIKDENDMNGGSIIYDVDWITDDWNTVSRDAIVLQNDIIYYSSANNAVGASIVGSINETAGDVFVPTDAVSYNHNTEAVDLPNSVVITCLGESGLNLLIGTSNGVYSWDTVNSSFNLPVLRGSYVNSLVNYANLAYAFAGEKNDIYATNGAVAELVAKLPEHFFSGGCTIIPNGTTVFNDKIMFLPYRAGNNTDVWSFEPKTRVFKIEYETGSTDAAGCVFSISKTDFFASAGGGYSMSLANRYCATGYLGFFISPVYQVGLPLRKRRMSKCKIILDRPLTTGQGVKVYTRTNLSDSWTLRSTFDYATYGAKESIEFSLRQVEAQIIQFKVELTTGASSTTTPYLRELRCS